LTVSWRWLVPRYVGAIRASSSIVSWRTFDGPEPKRPSTGRSSWGSSICSVSSLTCASIALVMTVSRRIAAIEESATLAIDARAKALKAAGEDVIGFGAGEPDFATPAHIVAAAQEACALPASHHYTATAGLPALPQAIADKTARDSGLVVEAGQVLV